MKFRVFYHIAFWLIFVLFLLQFNSSESLNDNFDILLILAIVAAIVYSNLYFLFPKYFFKKKYWTYSFCLLLLISLGAFSLKSFFYFTGSIYYLPIFEIYVNLIFFVFITSSLKFLSEYFKNQKRLAKIENEQLKTELSLLKSQVNPHFLFNTLNNLYGLITQNQNLQAAKVTLNLSDLMRYVLESSKTEKVSLYKEVRFLEDYLSLERIRLAQNADIRFEVSGLEKEVFVAPLLFIPLVENAFKHGLNSIEKGNFAHFSLSVQKDEIFFESQNAVNISIDHQHNSRMGLKNLRKRLQLVYPEKHQLEIEENQAVFKVTLHIKI